MDKEKTRELIDKGFDKYIDNSEAFKVIASTGNPEVTAVIKMGLKDAYTQGIIDGAKISHGFNI